MCDYPGCDLPKEYIIGVSKPKSKKMEQFIGYICNVHMRPTIENIMEQCFGTELWVTIYDLERNFLYHSYDADKEGYTAAAGWEMFLNK